MSLLLGPSGPVSEVSSLYLWTPHLRMENIFKTKPRDRVAECLSSIPSAVGLRSSTAKEKRLSMHQHHLLLSLSAQYRIVMVHIASSLSLNPGSSCLPLLNTRISGTLHVLSLRDIVVLLGSSCFVVLDSSCNLDMT